jgi:hypothetical protein
MEHIWKSGSHTLAESSIYTYADDTSSSCQDSVEQVVIKQLEEDAKSILEFMASNGLVANPSKNSVYDT